MTTERLTGADPGFLRVVVSGGGSGGHIFPALAVAEGLRRLRPDTELLYIGGSSGMETRIVPERGVPFQAVTARKLRRVLSPSTLLVAWSLFQGYREARTYLRAFRASAVIGTGGYVAAAAVLAGARMNLPTLIVAPDLLPGRTNLMLARFVRRICVGFAETIDRFPAGKSVVTGMPLRRSVVAPSEMTQSLARTRFVGLRSDPFTVLVIGGSQGARALNDLMIAAAPTLLDAGAQILHQTGARNIEETRARASALLDRGGYCATGFLDEEQVPAALRAADVIVCRGGISTLSENLVNGLPALIIPLPTAYADHQTVNARAIARAGAALWRPESEMTAATLVQELLALRDDATRREQMAQASLALSRPHAAEAVAAEMIKLIET